MFLRRLDCLVVVGTDLASSTGVANVRYLTQIGPTLDAYVIFPLVGDPIVYYAAPHMHVPIGPWQQVPGRWVEDVRPDAGVAGVLQGLQERGLGKRVGVVGYRHMLSPLSHVSAAFLDELRRGLPHAAISDETPLVEELRMIKSPEELAFLRRAGAIARKKIDRLIETARPGNTEADVWAAMEHETIVNGGEPATFNMFSSGPVTGDSRVQALLHGAEVPHSPSMRELGEGDLIICEFHTSYGGYLAGTEFCAFIGEAPKELLRVREVAGEVVRMAKDLFVPGRTARDVYGAFHQYVDDSGLDFIELGFHGHGLASPEFPAVVHREVDHESLGLAGMGDMRLRENMVLGMNVDLHDPAWRRDVGVMLGEMVRVTPDGAEYLCDVPLDVFELPVEAAVRA
jgi:Xaa-Pro aminopeptidase